MKLIIGSALLVSAVLARDQRAGSYKAPEIKLPTLNFDFNPRYERKYEPSPKYEPSTKHDSSSSETKYDSSSSETKYESESSHKPHPHPHPHPHPPVSHYCGENEIPVTNSPGLCECDYTKGFARLDGKNCIKCPVNGHWEPAQGYKKGECVCDFEFTFSYGKCVKRYH